VDEAFEFLGAALEAVDATGERWFQAELHRHRAEWLAKHGKDSEAAADFQRALVVARRQHARMWELQAVSSLAYFSYERGQRAEASDVASVLATFTEGFEMPALHDAKVLLERFRHTGGLRSS
jgi:predicted ATPase